MVEAGSCVVPQLKQICDFVYSRKLKSIEGHREISQYPGTDRGGPEGRPCRHTQRAGFVARCASCGCQIAPK